jgi:hypothetical protein
VPPKKSGRRRSDDETGRRFRRAAKRLTCQIPACARASLWLADTLDWLDLWQRSAHDDVLTEDPAERANNDLSLHL